MADVEMVVVDGIRYRPEDAPKRPKGGADASTGEDTTAVTSKTARPRNKARSASTKEG